MKGSIRYLSVPGFFGRVDSTDDIDLLNKVVIMRKKELVDEISVLMAKLNFGYEEAMNLDVETRKMFLDRIQELFSQDKKSQQQSPQAISKKDKEFLKSNQERFGKGQKR